MDGMQRVLEVAAAGLVVGLTLFAMGLAIWAVRWAINHGVDSVAALFGRGAKAKRRRP